MQSRIWKLQFKLARRAAGAITSRVANRDASSLESGRKSDRFRPVQIATDNHRNYAFAIRAHFEYEGYSYGTERVFLTVRQEMTRFTRMRLG